MFDSQVALLTASTSGIGLEAARLLGEGGARAIVINGRDESAGQSAAQRLRQLLPEAEIRFVAADVNIPEQAERLVQQTTQAFGQIDVFIHCGGAQVRPNLFVNIDPGDYSALIDGHFRSLLNCCRFVVPAMIARSRGAIVTVASDAGKIATPGETVIGAMKAAAIMFTRTLALELSRHQVRANCVTPSLVAQTKSHDRVMSNDLGRRVFEKATARARLGLPVPADVAQLVVFLASPMAARITGQAVSVNGGISAA